MAHGDSPSKVRNNTATQLFPLMKQAAEVLRTLQLYIPHSWLLSLMNLGNSEASVSKAEIKRKFYSQLSLAFKMPWHVTSGYFQVSVACRQTTTKVRHPVCWRSGHAIFCKNLSMFVGLQKQPHTRRPGRLKKETGHSRLVGGRSK